MLKVEDGNYSMKRHNYQRNSIIKHKNRILYGGIIYDAWADSSSLELWENR